MDNISHICAKIIADESYAPEIGGVYIRTFEPGYNMEGHSHPLAEVISVIHGSSYMVIDGQYIKIKKNECLVIFPGIRHRFFLHNNESCRLVNVHFKPGLLPDFQAPDHLHETLRFLQEVKTHTMRYLRLVDNTSIRNVSERILKEKENGNPFSEALLKLYFCELYILLSKVIKDDCDMFSRPVNPYLQHALEYIRNFYCEGITVRQTAEYAGISARHLSRLFAEDLHIGVQEYINTLRIKKSKALLESATMDITGIAHALGFCSSQYFTTCFRKYTSFSPKEYKKLVHGLNSNKN